MSHRPALDSPLSSRTIALPESRQLDILAALFERRGARVLRVPLVAIHDAPEQAPVTAWLAHFVARPPDLLIVLTGEGLRRLRAAARRQDLETDFIETLARVVKLCRGPKPGRALKEMGLEVDYQGKAPTTEGIIATLEGLDLAGRRVAVQLYGDDPNPTLRKYLATRDLADYLPVAPYVYGDATDTSRVLSLIQQLAAGAVDMIAFTSKPQVRRLYGVARQYGWEQGLAQGLKHSLVAAVGPVVREELARHGCAVAVMPATSFFMKPLVRAAEAAFAKSA